MQCAQVFDHKFPSGCDLVLVTLDLHVEQIARDNGLKLEVWEEDGLGTMRGFFVELCNKSVVLLSESDHLRKHFNKPGPYVHVDALDAVNLGHACLLSSTLESLHLTKSNVYEEPSSEETWLQQAQELVDLAQAFRESKSGFS